MMKTISTNTILTLCILTGVVGFVAGATLVGEANRATSIEIGCGRYNPQTGDFEWVKKGE